MMKFKKFFTSAIEGYQFISAMLPKSCRYYPSCSEYAKWLFETTNPAVATYKSTIRILRCNQLFEGGIDYPLIKYNPKSCKVPYKRVKFDIDVKYWIVPKRDNSNLFYIVKDFKWQKR